MELRNIIVFPGIQHDTVFPITKGTKENGFESYIQLYNIGLGAAKEIEIEWEYKKNEVEQLIKGVYHFYENENDKKESISFLSANNKYNFEAPYFYLKCYGGKLNQSYIDLVEPVNKISKPLLKMKISYKDIYNNSFEKKFEVMIKSFLTDVTFNFKEI